MSEITILLVGDMRRAEFRDIPADLQRLGRVVAAASPQEAVALLAEGEWIPDLIVIAQTYPGQFSTQAVDRLRRLAPLARVLGLLGTWCEGEMRTGKPWPAAIRVYWHQWHARAQQELGWLRQGVGAAWALPMTASEEERILALAEQPIGQREGLVAIVSPHFAMQEWLAAACRRHGYSTLWLRPTAVPPHAGFTAAIFDTTECRNEAQEALARWAAAVRPAPVIALLDFPRVDDRDRALAAGAAAVLSKPLLIEDLFWVLDRV